MVEIQKQAVPRWIFVINIKKFSMTLNVYNITRKFVIFADFGHIANDWLPFRSMFFPGILADTLLFKGKIHRQMLSQW